MLTPEEDIKVKDAVIEGCDTHMKRLRVQQDVLCIERGAIQEEMDALRVRLCDVDAQICKIGLEMKKCREVKTITQKLLDQAVPALVMQEVGA